MHTTPTIIMAKKLARSLTEDERLNPLFQIYEGVAYQLAPAEGDFPSMKDQYPFRLEVIIKRAIPVRIEVLKVIS